MQPGYQARWCSKGKADVLRRSSAVHGAMVLDSFNGIILVEPAGAALGDGVVLSPQEADLELRPVWSLERKTKLVHARKLLGLTADSVERAALAGR